MGKNLLKIFFCFVLFSNLSGQSSDRFSEAIVSVTGKILEIDGISTKPAKIMIELYNDKGELIEQKISEDKTGYYFFSGIEIGKSYYLYFNDPDYFKSYYELFVPNSKEYEEYSKDFVVVPKTVGIKFPIMVQPFFAKRTSLRPGSYLFLKEALNLLKYNEKLVVTIKCYSDNDLDSVTNKKLTEKRAMELKTFFLCHGISPRRMKIEGAMGMDPLTGTNITFWPKAKRYVGKTYFIINGF